MTEREALKLALEALEYPGPSWLEGRQPAIDAIKQALAHPEQEPVAWIDRICLKNLSNDFEPTISKNPVSEFDVPLYTQIGTKNDIQ